MGTQLIFCVETNKQCKSDQIYIRDTIERSLIILLFIKVDKLYCEY